MIELNNRELIRMSHFKKYLIVFFILIVLISTYPFLKKKALKDEREIPELDEEDTECKVRLIVESRDALETRLTLIENAKESISLCTYNMNSENYTTQLIIAALIRAAERGVKVKVFVDAKFGFLSSNFIRLLSNITNFEVFLYNPINLKEPSTIQVSLHNKFLICDDTWVVSGGRNVNDNSLREPSPDYVSSHDLDVLVKSDRENTKFIRDTKRLFYNLEVSKYTKRAFKKERRGTQKLKEELLSQFDQDVNLQEDLNQMESSLYKTDRVILINNSVIPTKKVSYIWKVIVKACLDTQGKTSIMTPYLLINDEIEAGIKMIGEDHELEILTNSLNSSPNYPAYSNYLLKRKSILSLGFPIYEYLSKGHVSVHTKAFVMGDGLCAVGSLNLDNRSLYINTEQIIIVEGEGFYNELSSLIESQKEESILIENSNKGFNDHEKDVSLIKRILMKVAGYIFYPFRYFL